MNIAYYISGHGYGHAVRSIEVIKHLQENYRASVFVRTGAPEWLFEPVIKKGARFFHRHIESGIVQSNSFTVDKKATLETAAKIITNKAQIVKEEVHFLVHNQIDLAIIDHTPIAFEAAARAGVPAAGAANFSWDWIYMEYVAEYPQYSSVLDDIRASYQFAETLYRLPFHGPMNFYDAIIDVPLVGRKGTLDSQFVRRQLGFPELKKKLILIALKESDVAAVSWENVGKLSDYHFLILSRNSSDEKNIHQYSEGKIPFEELVASCDAVLSKPGYSMVAETIVNRTPMVYVPREDFVEDRPLVAGLEKYAVCQKMDKQSFLAGEWGAFFDELFQKDQFWPDIATDGARVIAEEIGRSLGK